MNSTQQCASRLSDLIESHNQALNAVAMCERDGCHIEFDKSPDQLIAKGVLSNCKAYLAYTAALCKKEGQPLVATSAVWKRADRSISAIIFDIKSLARPEIAVLQDALTNAGGVVGEANAKLKFVLSALNIIQSKQA